jgi:hypothetical protein
VPLIFGDVRGHERQFGDLVPGRFGIAGLGLRGQVVAATSAGRGYEGDDVLEPLGRQSSLQRRRMSGLGTAFFAGGCFDDGLGCLGWIGGGRQGRVGGVLAESFFEATEALLQGDESLLQTSDNLVTLPTTRAGRSVHTPIL